MHKFKVGDRVTSRWPGDRSNGLSGRVARVFRFDCDVDFDPPFAGWGDEHSHRWSVAKENLVVERHRSRSSATPKFLLRYELDVDPVEEFATLPGVKARIKELLSNRSLKRDSIKVYELKSILDVQIQDLIVMKRVT